MKRGRRFEVKGNKEDGFWFTLHAVNGQEIARSHTYKTKDGVENCIASVRKNSCDAPVVYAES